MGRGGAGLGGEKAQVTTATPPETAAIEVAAHTAPKQSSGVWSVGGGRGAAAGTAVDAVGAADGADVPVIKEESKAKEESKGSDAIIKKGVDAREGVKRVTVQDGEGGEKWNQGEGVVQEMPVAVTLGKRHGRYVGVDSVGAAVGDSVGAAVAVTVTSLRAFPLKRGVTVGDSFGAAVVDCVGAAVGDCVGVPVGDCVGAAVGDCDKGSGTGGGSGALAESLALSLGEPAVGDIGGGRR